VGGGTLTPHPETLMAAATPSTLPRRRRSPRC
jgi:hypothetical protein